MAEQEIALLKEQIEKLHQKNFDLDAWKSSTLIFLERFFGKEDSKLKMIGDLKYDYSSWNLRNTAATGKERGKDPVLMQAEEILEAAISELKTMGTLTKNAGNQKIMQILNDELTGKEFRELVELSKNQDPMKKEKLLRILEKLGKEQLAAIVVKMITD